MTNALLELADILKPFAEVADQYHPSEDGNFEVWVDAGPERTIRASFKLEHYRRARTALAAIQTGSASLQCLVEEAQFLCDRLDELDWSVDLDTTANDFNGHVSPSHYRLKGYLERVAMQPAVDTGIFEEEPWFENVSQPEPSLRTIVHGYYAKHFDAKTAITLTDKYFDVLVNA